MSVAEKVPLMRQGNTVRNVVITIVYFLTMPIWLILLPVIALVLVWRDYGGIATSLSQIPGISEGGGVLSGVVALVLVFVLFGIIGAAVPSGEDPGQADPSQAGQDPDEPTGTADANARDATTDGGTNMPTATATKSPTPTMEPTPTATPTPVPATDGDSYSFTASGNDVTDSFSTQGGLVVFDFQHDGSSNFQVKAVNSAGDEEFLVNEIGRYDGEVAIYLPSDDWRLDITADGSWSAEITQPRFNENDIKPLPASADGEHAAWFGPFEFQGSTEVTFEIKDDSQAAVWLATHEGEKIDLLHNEIGPYQGTALVTDSGVGLIIVDTDSAEWRIEIGG
jgi:hypothetical protein